MSTTPEPPRKSVNTQGGTYVEGGVTAGGDFVGRDKKTYVRIGKLNVPLLPALIIPVLILAGVIAILGVLLRPIYTGPTPMKGIFNVAVADFGAVDDPASGPAHESKDGLMIANLVYEELNKRLEDESVEYLSQKVKTQHEFVGLIKGDSAEERQKRAAAIAQAWNADVVIYGNIVRSSGEFQPEFYVSPSLTGAEESTGPEAFGAPIKIEELSSAMGKAALSDDFFPRSEALTHILFGMAFVKVNRPDDALQQFEASADVKEWKKNHGREVLHLWQGTAYLARALNRETPEKSPCPQLDPKAGDDFTCARAAYEKSLEIKSTFARAYIGLGKVIFDQAQSAELGAGTCAPYADAAQAFLASLQAGMQSQETAYVALKAYLNAGIAYRIAYEEFPGDDECGPQYYEPALKNLNAAAAEYQKLKNAPPVARELAARTYYELGRAQVLKREYDSALASIAQSIEIAEPEKASSAEQRWQSIRWAARQLRAETLIYQAEAGDTSRWQEALAELDQVIAHYQTTKNVDPSVTANAYYHKGMVFLETEQAIQAIEPLSNSIRIAKEVELSDKQYVQSILWLGPLQMGKAYTMMARADATQWPHAIQAYNEVIALFESATYPIAGNVAAEAYDGLAGAYAVSGDKAGARQSYERLLQLALIETQAPELAAKARAWLQSSQ